jgi:hypothetical protein
MRIISGGGVDLPPETYYQLFTWGWGGEHALIDLHTTPTPPMFPVQLAILDILTTGHDEALSEGQGSTL